MIVATFANKSSQKDLEIFLYSLNLWNNSLKVYIFCDTEIQEWLHTQKYTFPILTNLALDKYTTLSRKEMEHTKGTHYQTMWGDLMGEKMNLLDWVFKEEKYVFLLDSDICFTGPLPEIPPGTQLALSPHYINLRSTIRFGKYNGGFLYTSNPNLPQQWREATKRSRYFEQAALEELAILYKTNLHEFPLQVNYGWWRMFQADEYPEDQQKAFSIFRGDTASSGIRVHGLPLASVHTHFHEKNDQSTKAFNEFIVRLLKLCGTRSVKSAALAKVLV